MSLEKKIGPEKKNPIERIDDKTLAMYTHLAHAWQRTTGLHKNTLQDICVYGAAVFYGGGAVFGNTVQYANMMLAMAQGTIYATTNAQKKEEQDMGLEALTGIKKLRTGLRVLSGGLTLMIVGRAVVEATILREADYSVRNTTSDAMFAVGQALMTSAYYLQSINIDPPEPRVRKKKNVHVFATENV